MVLTLSGPRMQRYPLMSCHLHTQDGLTPPLLSPIFRDNVRMIRCVEMRVSACNNLILCGGDLSTAASHVLDNVQVIRCVDNISDSLLCVIGCVQCMCSEPFTRRPSHSLDNLSRERMQSSGIE